MTVDQLSGVALRLNSAVVVFLKRSPWSVLDEKAMEENRAEVERGWPAESKEWTCAGTPNPIQQKSKMRLFDDFTTCGVNATVGLPERLRVESVDQVVAILLTMMKSEAVDDGLPWTGRTFESKAACKQFCVSEEEAQLLKIALKDSGRWAYNST